MKIDITKLEGYRADMTAEEKLALIEKYEIPEPNYSGYVKKEIFDKKATEAAEWKRKHDSLLSEDERKEAQRLEAEAAIKAELEALKREKAIAENKARFLSLGYDEKLASETAIALADGDMEKVFANQAKHIENVRKAERMAILAAEPKPSAGRPTQDMTKEQFSKLSLAEKQRIAKENPDIYKMFYTEDN